MIKTWGNFINENANFLEEIKKKLSTTDMSSGVPNFIGEKELDELYTKEFSEEVQCLFIYTEYRYTELSKEIRNFLNETFSGSRWTDGWISLKETFKKNSYSDKLLAMKDMIDFIEKVKPELDTDGYPKQSELCKRVESICINSLDQDIVEFFEVREEWNGVYVELGYDANLTVDKLHSVADELLPLKERIIEEEKLKHTELIFENQGNIMVIFE